MAFGKRLKKVGKFIKKAHVQPLRWAHKVTHTGPIKKLETAVQNAVGKALPITKPFINFHNKVSGKLTVQALEKTGVLKGKSGPVTVDAGALVEAAKTVVPAEYRAVLPIAVRTDATGLHRNVDPQLLATARTKLKAKLTTAANAGDRKAAATIAVVDKVRAAQAGDMQPLTELFEAKAGLGKYPVLPAETGMITPSGASVTPMPGGYRVVLPSGKVVNVPSASVS